MPFCKNCGAPIKSRTRVCPECGVPLFTVMNPLAPALEQPMAAVASGLPMGCGPQRPKRISIAVLLSALFGPFGLLYSSVTGALFMLVAWSFLVLATCDDWIGDQMIVTLIAWPVCVAWAAVAARSFNQDLR